MFSKPIKAGPRTSAAPGKPAKQVETLAGVEEVAALEACMKAIKGLLDLKKDELKSRATDRLIDLGTARKSKPDALSLVEGAGTATAAITKRSVVSPLSQDELDLVAQMVGAADHDAAGTVVAVPGFTEVMEKQPAMLAVNPVYASDEALLKKIDKALAKTPGIPEDFILAIEAETKAVVSDTATTEVFRLDPEVAAQVFPLIAGVSIRAVHKDLSAAWNTVRPMLAPSPAAAKEAVNAMLKASAKKEAAA